MCHATFIFHYNVVVWLISIFLIITFLPTSRSITTLLDFSSVPLIMPVTTRSMARGGLQTNNTSAPLPSLCPTCTNAIQCSSESCNSINNMSVQEQLPDLFNQAQDTPSSSEFDSNLDSFVDLDFENSEFENFKLKKSTSLPILIISNTSQLCNMESDCKEEGISTVPGSSLSSSNDEILKLLTAISSQMVVGHQDLQNQLISNNHQLKEELQRVKEENEKFKQEIRAEISTSSSVPTMPTPTVPPVVSTSVPLITTSPSSGSMSQVTNSADFQNQMLAVLNDTFSKLSSVISDTSTILQDTKTAISESKSSETKSE